MAGHLTLDQAVGVRVPVPQLIEKPKFTLRLLICLWDKSGDSGGLSRVFYYKFTRSRKSLQ